MATVNCTNVRDCQAIKSQSAYVNLSAAESLSIIPLLVLGQKCIIESSSKIGYIDFIDTYGHSFRMRPEAPQKLCDSNTPGVLKVNELITITL